MLGVLDGQVKAEVFDAAGVQHTAEGGAVVDGTWTHLAVTWQTGGQFIAYIGGTPVVTATASAQPIGSGCEAGNGGCNVVIGASTVATGTLDSTANTEFLVEFFANPAADDDGTCEGETFVGFVQVTTGAGGNATVYTTLAQMVPAGYQLAASATNLVTGDTSEFSACAPVAAASPAVNLTPFQRTVGEGDGVATLTVTLSVSTSVPITIEYSTGLGTATAGADYAPATDQSVVVPAGQASATITIAITDDDATEGDEIFPVSIDLPAGSIATLGPDTASAVTIVDDDGQEAHRVYLPLIAR